MKAIILGASGSLASYVIKEVGQHKDLELTLFVRNQQRLSVQNNKMKVIEGDVMDYEVLRKAIYGHDIVYINLAGNLEAMSMLIIDAMKETGVKRVIAISSIGIYQTPMKSVLRPYRKLADVI